MTPAKAADELADARAQHPLHLVVAAELEQPVGCTVCQTSG